MVNQKRNTWVFWWTSRYLGCTTRLLTGLKCQPFFLHLLNEKEVPHWGERVRASALNSNKRGPLDRQLQSLHFWNSVRNSKRTGRRCTSMTLGKWHTIGAPLIYLHIRWEFDTSCSFTITTNFLNASLATVKEWSLFQADVTSQCMWYIAYCTTYCILHQHPIILVSE